jgi:hypothetical protein
MIFATSPWTTGWAAVLGAVGGAPTPAPPVLDVFDAGVPPVVVTLEPPAADACEAPVSASKARPGNTKRVTRN